MTQKRDDLPCGICGSNKSMHEELNHEWSPEGVLLPKQTERKSPPMAPVDLLLRRTLIELGLITPQDLTNTLEKIRAERTRQDPSDSHPENVGPDRGTGAPTIS